MVLDGARGVVAWQGIQCTMAGYFKLQVHTWLVMPPFRYIVIAVVTSVAVPLQLQHDSMRDNAVDQSLHSRHQPQC